jgi:hypothetical protein
MYINWDVTIRFDPNSLEPSTQHGIPVPSYGNYGGPNYTAGVEGGTTPEIPFPAPTDDLDLLFYNHDLVYQHFKDQAATIQDVAQADITLVESMYALMQDPTLDSEALLYASFATLGIVGKILTTPDELTYFQALPLAEQYLVGVLAPREAVENFGIGLAETPGKEARSLHGAFHVFEAHYSDLLF